MVSKKIIVSMPEAMYDKLQVEKKKLAYVSVQEIILELLRDKYFKPKSRRGRPKKVDEDIILGKRRVFSREGVKVDV